MQHFEKLKTLQKVFKNIKKKKSHETIEKCSGVFPEEFLRNSISIRMEIRLLETKWSIFAHLFCDRDTLRLLGTFQSSLVRFFSPRKQRTKKFLSAQNRVLRIQWRKNYNSTLCREYKEKRFEICARRF